MYQLYKREDGHWCEAEEAISELLRLREFYRLGFDVKGVTAVGESCDI